MSNAAMMSASTRSPMANCKTIEASSIQGTGSQNRRAILTIAETWGSMTAFGPNCARRCSASRDERPCDSESAE